MTAVVHLPPAGCAPELAVHARKALRALLLQPAAPLVLPPRTGYLRLHGRVDRHRTYQGAYK